MELLRLESMMVTELAAPFDVSLEAASKHIRILEAAGLVSRSIRGRDHVLSLDAEPLLPAAEWIERYRSFWEERLRALESYLKERHDGFFPRGPWARADRNGLARPDPGRLRRVDET
jgi:predicted transcriptional regulator